MELGAFSVSLSVKDLEASRAFYEKLGFSRVAGDVDHNYLILANGPAIIGLFHGMFEGNILTFNPGWAGPGQESAGPFADVRDIARRLREEGIAIGAAVLPDTPGPGHLTLVDPDGNAILIDQHR